MRHYTVRDALLLSYAAAAWSLMAGTAAIVIGAGASSTALIGTGTDVLADLVSSIVLVWRYRAELHGGRLPHEVEQRAHRVAALALLAVALGVTAGSTAHLVAGTGASSDIAAIVIAAVSLVALPVFGVAKYRVARAINSRALRTDGTITMVGASTAALSLTGLALTAAYGWHAADPVAALGVAVLAGFIGARELRASRR